MSYDLATVYSSRLVVFISESIKLCLSINILLFISYIGGGSDGAYQNHPQLVYCKALVLSLSVVYDKFLFLAINHRYQT